MIFLKNDRYRSLFGVLHETIGKYIKCIYIDDVLIIYMKKNSVNRVGKKNIKIYQLTRKSKRNNGLLQNGHSVGTNGMLSRTL